jgi:periplasmic protein TonB
VGVFIEAGHGPLGAGGRLRFFGAVGLALCMHGLLLVSARPTLLGSAPVDGAVVMVVRTLVATPAGVVEQVESVAEAPAPPQLRQPLPAPPQVPVTERGGFKPLRPASAGSATLVTESAAVVNMPVVAASTSAPAALTAAPALAEPGLPPAPAYLPTGRLDPGPQPLGDITPVYPKEGELQEGWVVLRLLIDEAGKVDNAAVHSAYPKGLFDAAALEAFGRAQYSPGKLLGVSVKSQITFRVEFMPIDRGGLVSGRSY